MHGCACDNIGFRGWVGSGSNKKYRNALLFTALAFGDSSIELFSKHSKNVTEHSFGV
jgi:hypothetical protein